ncbi:hypothetical protein FGB62_203g027 [Gracilaria domingensis]|nr:hypothetical protein FGB62_203g027 [Gracilaria domingensis]
MNALKVGGVPEAFNDPFSFADYGSHGFTVSPSFASCPGGSGSMLKGVINGELDAAFALTDCIVAAIENKDPVRIAGPLVKSPLTWAVIVNPKKVVNVKDLSDVIWGISRMNSGSHVMVYTLAKEQDWSQEPKFKVCGNFAGLRNSLEEGIIDAFLWEHYTTKPYADKGIVKIIGGIPTPWSCFTVVVREGCERLDEVHRMTDAFVEAGKQFVNNDQNAEEITKRHGMSRDDALAWMAGVRQTLHQAGVIKEFGCPGGIASYHA